LNKRGRDQAYFRIGYYHILPYPRILVYDTLSAESKKEDVRIE